MWKHRTYTHTHLCTYIHTHVASCYLFFKYRSFAQTFLSLKISMVSSISFSQPHIMRERTFKHLGSLRLPFKLCKISPMFHVYDPPVPMLRSACKRPMSAPVVSVAGRIWVASTPNRYQPKRPRSCPVTAGPGPETATAAISEIDWHPKHASRTLTFGYQSSSMDSVIVDHPIVDTS